jgi:hypothetical protein
VGENNRCRTK